MRIWPFSRSVKADTKSATSTITDPGQWLLELIGGATTSDLAVSTADALTVPAVSSCIRIISEAAASLNLKVEAKDGDGKWSEVPDHPVSDLLTNDVNDWLGAFDFIRDLVAQALINDMGGLAYVNWAGNKPVELIHYDSGNITAERSTDGTGELSYSLAGKSIPARNVLHLRGPFHRSPMNMAKEAIGAAKVMEAHAGGLFKRGARPGGVIEMPQKTPGDDAIKRMHAAWKLAQEGSDNAGKTAILFEGAVWKAMTLNSVDAQFLELRKFQNIEIARAFRVPPSMLFELDRVTWSNGEQMGKEFLTYCLEPWLHALEGALRRGLFQGDDRKTHRVRFERDDLTRADLGSRAKAYNSLIASRIVNPNEVREWEDMPRYEGGDEFANPNTGASQPGQQSDPDDRDEQPTLTVVS